MTTLATLLLTPEVVVRCDDARQDGERCTVTAVVIAPTAAC